jgi:nicotinamidase/pyrazinamidase
MTSAMTSVLIVIDVQNSFMPGGELAVPAGHEVVPIINYIAQRFSNVVLTQDWHPAGHASFASSHPGRQPYESIDLAYGPQVLWPEHCVQGSNGAALHSDLSVPHAQLIIRKGFHAGVDSYSAFLEADRNTSTGLQAYLQARALDTVYLAGLATDFCVCWSALDARAAGFKTILIEDACRAIDLDGSRARAMLQMLAAGVEILNAAEVSLT